MDLIFSSSIIASFLAGIVALFAPCCITVLLPVYLASVFREKKNVLKMTLVFFLGIAAVLLPIGMGAAVLAQIFKNFHSELYIFGGLLMMILATMTILEKSIPFMPKFGHSLKAKDNHWTSIFVLGMFSGATTSCCAPVLAGAMTLAVISGIFWKALIVVFAYIFGMTFPLFILAYFYERFNFENINLIKGKFWEINVGSRKFIIHLSNLIAALIFYLMGAILLILAFSRNEFWAPSFQFKIGAFLNQLSMRLLNFLNALPNFVWGAAIIIIFLLFVYKSFKKK